MDMKPSSPRRFLIIVLVVVAVAVVAAVAIWMRNAPRTPGAVAPITSSNEAKDTTGQPTNQSIVASRQAKIVYIADGDDGRTGEKVGCGDSAVVITKTVQATSDVEGALQSLLADKSEMYGTTGLRNALWQSTLTLDSVVVVEKTATVKLSGNLQLAGVCDIPRVKAQLESTVRESSGATTVNVTINGKTLDDALSLK